MIITHRLTPFCSWKDIDKFMDAIVVHEDKGLDSPELIFCIALSLKICLLSPPSHWSTVKTSGETKWLFERDNLEFLPASGYSEYSSHL